MSESTAGGAGSPNWGDPPPLPSSPRGQAATVLRILAIVGTAAVVLWNLVAFGSMKPRQETGFIVLALAVPAVALTLFLILPAATRRLRRHPDVLVPLGLYIGANGLVNALVTIPAFAAVLTPSSTLKIAAVTITLSLLFAIQIVLGVMYVGWTTVLVLQAVQEERVDVAEGFAGYGRWFPRAFVAAFIGWVVLFAGLAIAIAVGSQSFAVALVLIGGMALVWNLATAALLPVVVADRGSLGSALAAGFRMSWAGKGRWWVPIVLQMLLLGWVTFIHITITTYPRPGTVTTHTKTNWNVHGFWTGGYEDTCHWHGDLMKAVEAEPLALVNTLLALLFSVLAIAIKLRIAGDVYGGVPEPTNQEERDYSDAVPVREARTSDTPQGEDL